MATCATPALADDVELRVRRQDIPDVGELAVELSTSLRRFKASSDTPGTVAIGVAEVSTGLSRHVELGIRLPVLQAWSVGAGDEALRAMGVVGELKAIAPHGDVGWYGGLELEVGQLRLLGQARSRQAELMAIVGWRDGRWHATANLGASRLIGQAGLSPGLRLKLTRSAGRHRELGAELYAEREPAQEAGLQTLLRRENRSLGLLTWDQRLGPGRLGLAAGRGWGADAPSRVFRLMWDFDLD